MIAFIWILFFYFIRSCIIVGGASHLRQIDMKRKMEEECDPGIGKHLSNIGDHAWRETDFTAEDYEEAKGIMEIVKNKLRENADTIEEGEKAVKSLNETFVLTELFPNINQDQSEQDLPDNATGDERMLSVNREDEIDHFMAEFEFYASNFPYNEALEKSRELESINLNEIYNLQGVTIENKESSINVHSMATFFEERGVISAKDASIAKDFYLSRDELHRSLSACSEKLIAYVANVFMLILAIFQVPSKAVGTASYKLARDVMKKAAIDAVVDLAKGFVAGQTAGAVANFVDKVICGTLSAGQILSAVKDALVSFTNLVLEICY